MKKEKGKKEVDLRQYYMRSILIGISLIMSVVFKSVLATTIGIVVTTGILTIFAVTNVSIGILEEIDKLIPELRQWPSRSAFIREGQARTPRETTRRGYLE